ncbi:MAG: SEC-C domain-containing protein [Acidobacteria bacterium]|nr:SEC-C domain-containing protein [Acidobacteriota bacterium]
MSHDKSFLSRTIGRNNQCWCGSGLKYKKCHLIQDQMK